MWRVFLIVSAAVNCVPVKSDTGYREPSKQNVTKYEESLIGLEHSLFLLANLTSEQQLAREQQHAYEKEVRSKNRENEERQAARSRDLDKQQRLFKEAWATLSRKLKVLSRKTDNAKDQNPSDFEIPPKDCADLYLDGNEASGTYKIWPTWSKTSSVVYCDMDTDGGGWTVIHRWGNYSFPKSYFKRVWSEYKSGFGDLESAFWLGNDLIYGLTSQGAYDLRFDEDDIEEYSLYRGFWIENESRKYKLYYDRYDGVGKGENILQNFNGGDFVTSDRSSQCGNSYQRGWWFQNTCTLPQVLELSFVTSAPSDSYVPKKELKIRPAQFLKMKDLP